MTEEQIQQFFQRIDYLKAEQKALFGKMNAHQMICHCADQLRLAIGTKKSIEYDREFANEVIALAKAGKSVPTPKGLGQVEGDGTKPIDFENDKRILKEHILIFQNLAVNDCAKHPYFGEIDKNRWAGLVAYHLNHHLRQFNV
jgi:Protein of unknown function (DUF1569)